MKCACLALITRLNFGKRYRCGAKGRNLFAIVAVERYACANSLNADRVCVCLFRSFFELFVLLFWHINRPNAIKMMNKMREFQQKKKSSCNRKIHFCCVICITVFGSISAFHLQSRSVCFVIIIQSTAL